jgi:sugar phosphate isomerase/epimerase
MASGSPDEQVNLLSSGRYRHAIHIAAELGADMVVLHANFIGALHNVVYREGWHKRNVIYWRSIAEYAEDRDVIVALENMWEYEPGIIADILTEIDHPNLRACLDVGHASLFGDSSYTLEDWIAKLEPWLVHVHMNNNNGVIDEHHGFDWEHGVLDYQKSLRLLRTVEPAPNLVLEMADVKDMRNSLYYFQLAKANVEAEAIEASTEKSDKEEPGKEDLSAGKADESVVAETPATEKP